jgi:hypothetical protein
MLGFRATDTRHASGGCGSGARVYEGAWAVTGGQAGRAGDASGSGHGRFASMLRSEGGRADGGRQAIKRRGGRKGNKGGTPDVCGQGSSSSSEEGWVVLGRRAGWAEQAGTGREAGRGERANVGRAVLGRLTAARGRPGGSACWRARLLEGYGGLS